MNKIEKLWEAMVKDLCKKDPHGDWPAKKIVMTQPFELRVVSLHEGFEKHESFCNFVRQEAIRKEDFDESSLPPDLLEYVKEYDSEYDNNYPNIIEAIAYGDTLEEAIEDMRKKLCLLDYGYILMDDYFYRQEILDANNGGWMLDDYDENDDDQVDDDENDDDDDENENERQKYLERLEQLKKEGKDKLPDNWEQMSNEKKCGYLDELLREILDYDSDYDINVTLQSRDSYALAFVQFTDEGCACSDEYDYVRCNLVRRDPNVTLTDLPKEFQDYAKEQFGPEDAEKATASVELVAGGKSFADALNALFDKIALLFYGYECLYFKGDYMEYCEEKRENEDCDWDNE